MIDACGMLCYFEIPLACGDLKAATVEASFNTGRSSVDANIKRTQDLENRKCLFIAAYGLEDEPGLRT